MLLGVLIAEAPIQDCLAGGMSSMPALLRFDVSQAFVFG